MTASLVGLGIGFGRRSCRSRVTCVLDDTAGIGLSGEFAILGITEALDVRDR
jgi:hypothetical protein